MTDDLGYRPCVGMMILNEVGNVFVGQRIDNPGEAWQMPQGGIDEGEEPQDAAMRELKEEIGTANVEIITQTDDWLRYDLPENLVGVLWKGRFRGQEQKWFVMRFKGVDSEIDIATPDPEFNAWQWVPMVRLPELIVPFKRALYADLVGRFQHLTQG